MQEKVALKNFIQCKFIIILENLDYYNTSSIYTYRHFRLT